MSLKATTFDICVGILALRLQSFNFKDNEVCKTVNDAFGISVHAKRGAM
jgi:hypothetical protein